MYKRVSGYAISTTTKGLVGTATLRHITVLIHQLIHNNYIHLITKQLFFFLLDSHIVFY